MKNALEHPWFKKYGLKSEIDNNNINNLQNSKNLNKKNSIVNDFGLYTGAVKK